ncbi:MAG: hypothetical protein ABEK04_05065 [Candidatus Nanohalobium sp.]
MYLVLSHAIALCALFINSLYDVLSEKGDVPDLFSVIAIVSGILLHGFYAWQMGSITPFLWMAGIGLAMAAYGWIAYWKGLWGGADAMGITVIGFAAPYATTGVQLTYPVNIFINIMIVGLLYTVGFALNRAIRSEGFFTKVKDRVVEDRIRIVVEIIAAGIFSAYSGTIGLNPYTYFAALVVVIFLYRFLKVLENTEMTKTVPVDELEGGEVVAESGKLIEGITEEEIEELEVDEVEVQEGIRFMPVFPVALLITDLFGGGLFLLLQLF